MAKTRKKREPLGEIVEGVEVKESPPKCYGQKEAFCRRELCGQWFDSCAAKLTDKVSV